MLTYLLSLGLLVSCRGLGFVSFLGTLHWPSGEKELGHFGVSYLEVLILFEQWAGHWLLIEKVVKPRGRAHRSLSTSHVPVSEGVDMPVCW